MKNCLFHCGNKPVETIESQGIVDVFRLTDPEIIDKISYLIKSLDVDKINSLMKMIEVDKDGWIRIKIELGIKK